MKLLNILTILTLLGACAHKNPYEGMTFDQAIRYEELRMKVRQQKLDNAARASRTYNAYFGTLADQPVDWNKPGPATVWIKNKIRGRK